MKFDFTKLAAAITQKRGDIESNITKFKFFYKKYLFKLNNYESILRQLFVFLNKIQNQIDQGVSYPTNELIKLDQSIESFLLKKFHSDIATLYSTELPFQSQKKKMSLTYEENVITSIIHGITQAYSDIVEKQKAVWTYKLEFIKFLYRCMYYYGLHPDIEKRLHDISLVRYNILLQHCFKSKINKTETKILISFEKLKREFLLAYEHKMPIKINGKLIPFEEINALKISSSILQDDEIELWAYKKEFIWNENKKNERQFILSCNDETDDLLNNPYLLEKDTREYVYVEKSRIDELHSLENLTFDLTKLIGFCEELNRSAAVNNYACCAFLVRAIIDHVPPIFGKKAFHEYANSCQKSIKGSMLNLDKSLRNIADGLIHLQVRNKEVLPTFSQVNFKQDLDVLLGEVCRVLK